MVKSVGLGYFFLTDAKKCFVAVMYCLYDPFSGRCARMCTEEKLIFLLFFLKERRV